MFFFVSLSLFLSLSLSVSVRISQSTNPPVLSSPISACKTQRPQRLCTTRTDQDMEEQVSR